MIFELKYMLLSIFNKLFHVSLHSSWLQCNIVKGMRFFFLILLQN